MPIEQKKIILKGVRVHNLKNVDLTLEPRQLIVFTGVSGSGKSSLAFETIYVEGQRRYIESLSTYARRHLGDMAKPDADHIEGISPTIAIEQKTMGRNPRSTVGTMTGIYDYMRVLFARIGIPHCPVSGEIVRPQSTEQIMRRIQELPEKSRLMILAPYAKGKKGAFKEDFAELQRKGFTRLRLDGKLIDLTEEIDLDAKVSHDLDLVIDRLVLREEEKGRLTEAITQALELGNGVVHVLNVDTNEELLFSKFAYSPKSGLSYGPLEPHDFSFNHPSGMCPGCQGLGTKMDFILERIIDPNLSIAEDCCIVASSYKTVRYGNIYDNLADLFGFSVHTPWKKLSEKAKRIFLYGTEKKWTKMHFVHPQKKQSWTEYVQWHGVLHEALKRFQEAKSDSYRTKMQELMEESICSDCLGTRIRPYAAATTLGGKHIHEISAFSIEKCRNYFASLSLSETEKIIAEELLKEIQERLHFLQEVGLHYLTLERIAPTLSGGESQRVRLASQIGSGLSHATYILDEPSIGLHPRDNLKLLESLKALCDKENTVIVVEHDEETIREADFVVDVGPLAGKNGGEIVAKGSIEDLCASERSITGQYLSGKLKIEIPKKRRPLNKKFLTIEKASHHNLKNITAHLPLEIFTAITGVSGSGKSSLISDILYPALANHLHNAKQKVGKHAAIKGIDQIDKVIAIDQTPIGRTPRSNPATYIKLFDEIRDLFSNLPESSAQGYKAGRFSFNVKEGCCPQCEGMGMLKIDMDFMEDEWITCDLCKGKRFDQKTLSVLYKGKNIHDILEMSVAEAYDFFANLPKIKEKLDVLLKVGLDYLRLGQSSPTLSGGEAQRIKLAKELSRPPTGKTLYILDEPTTGLHFHDIQKLIQVLQELVDRKNSVIVIEHNMDLVKTADWIIDLGPEGGEEGGQIIAEGTPEQIIKKKTPTAIALKPFLHPRHAAKSLKKAVIDQGTRFIEIKGATQNNLKNIDVEIPHGKITVCTGPSGSGKSSLAFETIYAEGQRRYVESLSVYSRQFIKQMPKPKIEEALGLMAAIAIEQKSHAGNPRSTIGTMTEIYDYLRVLFAHLGTAYCPETKEEIRSISKEFVLEKLMQLPEKTRLFILCPIALSSQEDFASLKERLLKEGFLRIRLNDEYFELDQEIPFDKRKKNALYIVIDRLVLSDTIRKRLYDAIDLATKLSGGTLVASHEGKDLFFNLSFAVPSTGKSYPPITPHTFSFNTSSGMCPDCLGLGIQYGANFKRHRSVMQLSATGLMLTLWKQHSSRYALDLFKSLLKREKIDPETPLHELNDEQLNFLLSGAKEGTPIESKGIQLHWKGINMAFANAAKWSFKDLRKELLPFLDEYPCPSCEGSRLNPLARHVKIKNHTLPDVCALPIEKALEFFQNVSLDKKNHHRFLQETLQQIQSRTHFLQKIGLGYLSLNRSAPSLSGGEVQRIRLARQLGSGLTGCLYVLDEPTIGLHPHDNAKLNIALQSLCKLGNTLILVEHDPLTLQIADYLIDLGPLAGKEGGQIIAQGTLEEIKKNPRSLTGRYLSGAAKIPVPKKRRKKNKLLHIEHASLHNLKDVSIDIPIGCFTCITGVSGSGKSTLMNDLLHPAIQQVLASRKKQEELVYKKAKISGISFDKLLVMDQSPIGHTIRADVSTYTDLLTPLRHFFSSLPEARARGLQPKNFSYNHRKGMCNACFGLGIRTIQLQFLPPVKVICDSCQGYRLNPLSLQIKTKGKHLGHVLQMSVLEAKEWLPAIPKIMRILETLISVGLGYLQLGQEITTLSGGEAQRLRLTKELAKRSTGRTLYLLDEPTIGLHSNDILHLLPIFHSLVDKGNTLVIIEHNLDLIANADYVIDLGPDAGVFGGEVIATGTPEEVAKHPTSYTAKYLAPYLNF